MKTQEIDKILAYLLSAYPNTDWGESKTQTRMVWHDVLSAFPYEVAQESSKFYILGGGKFFPSVGEFANLCDKVWERKNAERIAENGKAEREATRKLFHEPLSHHKSDYEKKSVQLIRNICEGKIKFKSEAWIRRFREIYPDVDPRTGE